MSGGSPIPDWCNLEHLLFAVKALKPVMDQLPNAVNLGMDFAFGVLGSAAWSVHKALSASGNRTQASCQVQNTVAAPGTLLGPNTLVSRAAKERCIDTGIHHGGWAQIGNKVHPDTAGHGNDGIILVFPVIQAVNIFLIALADEGSFLDLDLTALFFGAQPDERGKQFNFPFSTGGTHCYTATASQDEDLFMVPGHFNYFSNRLSLGNYHADSPLSGLGPNF
jgi:hypothetical protein